MKTYSIRDFKGGWFIGNFEPSAAKTAGFEVCYKQHCKGEAWPRHYHAVATEYNCLVAGKMIMQNTELNPGDIFVLEPGEMADPEFLEDCHLIVVKIPSLPNDKYEA